MKIPHTFTIVFVIIIFCAILTWLVPGGVFERQMVLVDGSERSVVIADSYHQTDHEPQTWQIFVAFFKGMERTVQIVAFILIIGGAFWIMNETNAIYSGITSLLTLTQRLQKWRFFRKIGTHNFIIVIVMLLFSLFGAVFGMSEETIAFIVIFVPLAISMGYDSVVGVLMCYVAAHVGFAGAMLNPFTIGIAQGLSGLAPFSGLEYRFFCWFVLTVFIITFTLIYAIRIKKKPQRSFMYKLDEYWRNKSRQQDEIQQKQHKSTFMTWLVYGLIGIVFLFCAYRYPYTLISIGGYAYSLLLFPILAPCYLLLGFFTTRKSSHDFILVLLLFSVIMLVVGVLGYQWYVMEIAGLFLGMGIASGLAFSLHFDHIIRLFLDGCKDIMTAALVVGMAGGIIIILEDGKVIDTILFAISQTMTNSGKVISVGGMYLIQNLLNIIIPSGSAKAALTIPMMAEFSDIVGISRQLTVLAFQFGDGFTNMITPTSGVLIGCLGVARIPYIKWLKFFLPIVLFMICIGFILLLLPLYFKIAGF